MITSWEIKFTPIEKYSNRYRLRLHCSPEDIEEVVSFLKEELGLDISPPVQSLTEKYNWGIYIYDLPEDIKSVIAERFYSICKNGIVEEGKVQLNTELDTVLKGLAKDMAKKVILEEKVQPFTATRQDTVSEEYYGMPLNPKFIFDTFVVGPNNRFTHAAALSVAENPGKTYNPLFIYGGVGLGKTHLMQSIGNYVRKKKPLSKIVYISAEKFVSLVIDAISKGKIQELRNFYSSVELLLVDDVQFMAESESTQEEFFHIFNTLHQYGHQIVLTSDRPPKLLTTLADRLRSRFEWGLIADIKSPSLETRVAILKKKSESEGVNVDDNILLYVASKLKSNVRELEGFLKRISAYASLTNQMIDMPLVKQLMSELLPETELTEEEKQLLTQFRAQQEGVVPTATQFVPQGTPKIQTVPSPSGTFVQPSTRVAPVVPSPHRTEPEKKVSPGVPIVSQPIKSQETFSEEDFYKEYESVTNVVEVAFFYPEGKIQELMTVKQKFAEVIKKHNLKFKITTVFDRPYNLDHINYHMFAELCKTNKINICIVLSPPTDSHITTEEFQNNLVPIMDNEKIVLEYVPWKDLHKEYRYLNLALDIALSKFELMKK